MRRPSASSGRRAGATPGRWARAAALSLLVSGCATHPVTVEMPPRAADPPGPIATRPGRPGVVVAAPHGTPDTRTGEIASEIARRTGFGLVVAAGFTPDEYERRVREAARAPLTFFVEIQGDGRDATDRRIEISTSGVDRGHALQLKALLELTRDAHLRTNAAAPRLQVLVEPVDTVFDPAGGVRPEGVLRSAARSLRIELPREARREFRALYTAILADFLSEAAALRTLR